MAVAAAAAATAVGAAVEYQELELGDGWANLEGGDWAMARYRRLVNVVRSVRHDRPRRTADRPNRYLPAPRGCAS